MNQFVANTGAMNTWQQQLTDLSTDVGNFINSAPGVSTVLNSHGTIGHPMQTAFDAAQSARGSAMGATQSASAKISDLLRQAAQAYERGDMASADKLKAQAQQMEGAAGAPSAAGGAPSAGGQDGGAQSAGQMMGQFGQIAGQMMQGVTQPLQGMAQALGQMPQQVFQGVQGIVQTATQGAAGTGGGAAAAAAQGANAGAAQAGEAPEGAAPAGAGAPETGEKAPVQSGIMSEERMRELQGEREEMQRMDHAPVGQERPGINPVNL